MELGGVLKNIYAIGLGLLDGKNIRSVNFRAVYLTIALEEIARFGVVMGAKIETFLYLSGIGDLLAASPRLRAPLLSATRGVTRSLLRMP